MEAACIQVVGARPRIRAGTHGCRYQGDLERLFEERPEIVKNQGCPVPTSTIWSMDNSMIRITIGTSEAPWQALALQWQDTGTVLQCPARPGQALLCGFILLRCHSTASSQAFPRHHKLGLEPVRGSRGRNPPPPQPPPYPRRVTCCARLHPWSWQAPRKAVAPAPPPPRTP